MSRAKCYSVAIALAAILVGVVACLLLNTEEKVHRELEQKVWEPMTDMPELKDFPEAGQWRVLYKLSHGDWYDASHEIEKGQRTHDRAHDRLIEHIFAYAPEGSPWPGFESFDPLPDSAVMSLNRSLALMELPEARTRDVVAACRARYYPNPQDKESLWYEVLYFELSDGMRFLDMARVPNAELRAAGAER